MVVMSKKSWLLFVAFIGGYLAMFVPIVLYFDPGRLTFMGTAVLAILNYLVFVLLFILAYRMGCKAP